MYRWISSNQKSGVKASSSKLTSPFALKFFQYVALVALGAHLGLVAEPKRSQEHLLSKEKPSQYELQSREIPPREFKEDKSYGQPWCYAGLAGIALATCWFFYNTVGQKTTDSPSSDPQPIATHASHTPNPSEERGDPAPLAPTHVTTPPSYRVDSAMLLESDEATEPTDALELPIEPFAARLSALDTIVSTLREELESVARSSQGIGDFRRDALAHAPSPTVHLDVAQEQQRVLSPHDISTIHSTITTDLDLAVQVQEILVTSQGQGWRLLLAIDDTMPIQDHIEAAAIIEFSLRTRYLSATDGQERGVPSWRRIPPAYLTLAQTVLKKGQ